MFFIDVAGQQVSVFIPPLVALLLSTFLSTGGVSGAFLLLPFQMSVLGFTSPSVSPTNQLYNVIAIPSGVIKYVKEGRMVWPLTWIVIVGTLPGVFIGAFLRIKYLPNPSNFKMFAGCLLLYIGYRLLFDLIKKKDNDKNSSENRFQELIRKYREAANNGHTEDIKPLPRTKVIKFNAKHLVYDFYGERFDVPTVKISLISFIVGIAGGAYGIGGGAIMAPLFVAFFGLPVYTVAGACLMGTFVTSVAGVIFYQLLDPFYPGVSVAPNWILGLLFGIGGLVGMYLGASLQKYMPAKLIKWILVISILFIAIKYILRF
jgi:uncharacterized membrane protein YfcA